MPPGDMRSQQNLTPKILWEYNSGKDISLSPAPCMDRAQLFDALSNLSPQDFERLLVGINMPRMHRAEASAKIGEQVSALLEWADSSIGPGVEAIACQLADLNRFEFDVYLRSLVATYEKWWEHYTLTDAIGKVEQVQTEQPSIFDFGLMVQTVTKDREPTDPESTSLQKDKEKTECLPVLEGIRKYADNHVLLVGRPGSGKSTALIRLLLEEATLSSSPSVLIERKEPARIPVLVELRYWQTSILERIRAFLCQHDPQLNLDDAALNSLLHQRRFLLLIDGLNELPSDEARTQLTTFRRDYPQVPMIFTTRDLGLGGDLGIEKKLEMQPLTEAQMKAFVRAYVPDQAEAMLRRLSDRLREFGQTPLLLWMLCEVFQQSPNRQMPTNLAEVFRAFTTMYEDSSVRKHEVALLKGDVRPLSDRRLWKDALKALAALIMQGETPVDFRVAIHRTEAERELGKLFASEKFPVRDILDDLLKYHLLQNRTTDQLEFRHQLIQEYYAAEHLLQLLPELSDEQLKRDYLNLLKWTEPVALMLALVDEEDMALRVVKLAMDDVDLMLGARLAGEVKMSLQAKTIGWINDQKIPTGLKVNCLATSHSEAAIPGLLQAIKDQDSDIRGLAAEALGQLGSDAVIPALCQALEDQDFGVRWSAAAALGQLGSDAAILVLRQALEDQDSRVRWSAAAALGQLESDRVIPALLQALEDQDSGVRRRAVAALGQLGSDRVIPALLQALEDQDSGVRKSAAAALGQLGSDTVIPNLFRALKDADSDVRIRVTAALEQLGEELETMKSIENLYRLLARTSDLSILKDIENIQNRSGLYKLPLNLSTSHDLEGDFSDSSLSFLGAELMQNAAAAVLFGMTKGIK
ncbi:NACHT domain-containing protein [Nodosilinea sp. PGN35]|uniref:NACHT domain-containing protein n=1 Tax=Nodosilinea sp. PGN35 TaxID=3020489 RepID=UPI0023B33368|nr:HEAT repeat domain-containing protein [Nodosilinea sp. TSF1-S3]MDF0365165.1 HEAT repeat domain-containing protein [Nodosilinea sp. TSF1-S3]